MTMHDRKFASFEQWLSQYLAQHPPRTKSLAMTLFGDVIVPHGGKVWMGSLIALLAPFNISDRLVRTSIFRLAEEGWLHAQREGRRSLYTLSEQFAGRFEHAHKRIYMPSYREWNGQWTLVLTTSESLTTQQRALLRKELAWQGFGTITPSVYLHPTPDTDIIEDILGRTGTRGKVFICTAASSSLPTALPLERIVDACWELDTVQQKYQQFVALFEPLRTLMQQAPLSDREAFMLRTLLTHHFRRMQLNDPQLPLALLPPKWPGKAAYELCHDIYQATCEQSEHYILATLREEDAQATDPAPYFYHRFGGLVFDTHKQHDSVPA